VLKLKAPTRAKTANEDKLFALKMIYIYIFFYEKLTINQFGQLEEFLSYFTIPALEPPCK